MGFVWQPWLEGWQEQFENYRRESQKERPVYGAKLRNWAYDMRKNWNELSPRRQELLTQAGLVLDPRPQVCESNLQEMEAYHRTRGHIRSHSVKLVAFARSMRNVRAQGKLKGDNWIQQRHEKAPGYASLWDLRYEQARNYLAASGTEFISPASWENKLLGTWVRKQLARWEVLPETRRRQLTTLGIFLGVVRQRLWLQRYEKAAQLYSKTGPVTLYAFQKQHPAIGGWMIDQMGRWKKLTQFQHEMLALLGLKPALPTKRAS